MNFSSWPPLLVVDVEGNGASPPDLVEVAALPVRNGQPDTRTAGVWLTKPNRPVTPFAAQVHGLTNQVLDGQPRWTEIHDAVHTCLGTAWIAAHHAHVDYRVLSAQLLIAMADHYVSWDQLIAVAVPPGAPEPEQEPTLW